jgi:hypothetical protein
MEVNQDLLLRTDDAQVWATEFHKVQPDVDVGLMISWFANAMETAERIQREKYAEAQS